MVFVSCLFPSLFRQSFFEFSHSFVFQTNLTQDSEVQVRVAYAENIALLAETALRFLEIVQISTTSESQSADSAQTEARYKVLVIRFSVFQKIRNVFSSYFAQV